MPGKFFWYSAEKIIEFNKNFFPASALGGFGQALVFTAASTAVRRLCQIYAETTGKDAYAAQGLFFGVFGVFLQIGNWWFICPKKII